MIKRQIAQPQRQIALLERHARVPGRRDEPPPVRIGAEDRRLHECALGDRLGHQPRIVARFGPIIAAPLAKPVSCTSLPISTLRVDTLMRVSVVRMACAARSRAWVVPARCWAALRMPDSMMGMGR